MKVSLWVFSEVRCEDEQRGRLHAYLLRIGDKKNRDVSEIEGLLIFRNTSALLRRLSGLCFIYDRKIVFLYL